MMTPREKRDEEILTRDGCAECHVETDIARQFKKTRSIRTEPHQGSWVNSPIYKARQVREIGKMDE